MTTNMIEKNILNTMNSTWTSKKFDVSFNKVGMIQIVKSENDENYEYKITVWDSKSYDMDFNKVLSVNDIRKMNQFGRFECPHHGYNYFVVTGNDEDLLEAMEELLDIIG